MVFIFRPCVQYVRIGEELDVADFENHVEGKAETGCFEDGGCFFLGGGERGDDAGGGEAGEGADVIGVPSVEEMSAGVWQVKSSLKERTYLQYTRPLSPGSR